MTKIFVAIALLLCNLVNAAQLRSEDKTTTALIQRLDALEKIVKKQEVTISVLEQSIEEHVQTISELQNHRHLGTNETSCGLEYDDGYCKLVKHIMMYEDGDRKLQTSVMEPADLLVVGKTTIKDGLEVEAGDCDNCIMFHDDVIFDDNAKFVDPVVFEDPVKFLNDVTIQGMEAPSSKSIKTSDTTYTSLDFKTTEYTKIKFDQDKKFVVTSATRFEKNMDIKLPSSPSSDATEPNLFVEGNLGVAGVIVN